MGIALFVWYYPKNDKKEPTEWETANPPVATIDNKEESPIEDPPEKIHSFVLPEGNTLASRIAPPKDFERLLGEEGSFTYFMRNLTLKEDGSPVILYNGEEKGDQSAHIAVFDLDIGEKDLQQCADSIMRVYAEYYWSVGAYENIAFHLTNGFYMEYTKWREGYRLTVDGNNTSWKSSVSYDDSYESFRKYLEMVFAYAGTLSLSEEGSSKDITEIQVGDMFIYGGSPGHCVLVVDMAENEQGERAFLLAQGYMPAQEFQVLRNPLHSEDPWYYQSEFSYPLRTPQWSFEEGSLKKWMK